MKNLNLTYTDADYMKMLRKKREVEKKLAIRVKWEDLIVEAVLGVKT